MTDRWTTHEPALIKAVAEAMFEAVRGKAGAALWADIEPVQAAYLRAAGAAVATVRRGEDCGDEFGKQGGLASLCGDEQSEWSIKSAANIDAGDYREATSSLPPRILPEPRH